MKEYILPRKRYLFGRLRQIFKECARKTPKEKSERDEEKERKVPSLFLTRGMDDVCPRVFLEEVDAAQEIAEEFVRPDLLSNVPTLELVLRLYLFVCYLHDLQHLFPASVALENIFYQVRQGFDFVVQGMYNLRQQLKGGKGVRLRGEA